MVTLSEVDHKIDAHVDICAIRYEGILALITLIVVLAKLDLRVAVLEEKVKTLFDLINKKPHNG